MARNKTKSSPVLPGLSRSTECRFGSCHRLAGHHGAHRGTLHAATKSPVAVSTAIDTEGGVEVLSADRYEVQPEAVKSRAKAAAKAQPTKSAATVVYEATILGFHVVVLSDGTVTSTPVVESPAPVVTNLPEAGAEGRDVQTVKGKASRRRRYTTSGRPSSRLA